MTDPSRPTVPGAGGTDAGPGATAVEDTRRPLLDRQYLLALVAALVVVGALWPLARHLDEGVDRGRPMYIDVQEMALLQYFEIVATGAAKPVELGSGEEVEVGGQTFATETGVELSVSAPDEGGYCITARNQFGDTTEELCDDGTAQPYEAPLE